mgnify:CR=1 FL=1
MKPTRKHEKTPFIKDWMPWHGDAFYGSFTVKSMTLEEEAVYLRLLWAAWRDRQCSLPSDEAALRKLSGGYTGDLSRVLSCWGLREGRLYNERLLLEWEKANDIHREHSRKAKAAAESRWQSDRHAPSNAPSNAPSMPQAMPEECPEQCLSYAQSQSQSQLHKQKQKRKSAAPLPAHTVCDGDWLKELQGNPAYQHIDFASELGKMDAWLSIPKNAKRKKTKSFVLSWLNRIEKPLEPQKKRDIIYT